MWRYCLLNFLVHPICKRVRGFFWNIDFVKKYGGGLHPFQKCWASLFDPKQRKYLTSVQSVGLTIFFCCSKYKTLVFIICFPKTAVPICVQLALQIVGFWGATPRLDKLETWTEFGPPTSPVLCLPLYSITKYRFQPVPGAPMGT